MLKRLLVLAAIVVLAFLTGIGFGSSTPASAATTKYFHSPWWDTHHVKVTCSSACHVSEGRGVGQDVIAHYSGHSKDNTAKILTPMKSGHYGIIVGVFTADGWHQHQSGSWHYHGSGNGCYSVPQPWGNGYDLYVGDNISNKAVVYRFAHMKTDGSFFWQSGSYIYAAYEPGDKLSWAQTMGHYNNTGWSCGNHLHWHVSIGCDSCRYAPTYSSLDVTGVEYGVWGKSYSGNGPNIDQIRFNCWVSSSNNCDPEGWF